jgi:hypothetical protein
MPRPGGDLCVNNGILIGALSFIHLASSKYSLSSYFGVYLSDLAFTLGDLDLGF